MPTYGGQRGNPIVLPGTLCQALATGGVNFGCRNLIERHPAAVVRIDAPDPHYVQDIDTPAAYDAPGSKLIRRIARRAHSKNAPPGGVLTPIRQAE